MQDCVFLFVTFLCGGFFIAALAVHGGRDIHFLMMVGWRRFSLSSSFLTKTEA